MATQSPVGAREMPLLQTKLYIPPPRPEEVPRPRLIERLNAGLDSGRKLTLISAPAGFGKTTLLSEWIHTVGAARRRHPAGCDAPQVAWFSLDESDNDPTRFLTYLIAALQGGEAQHEADDRIGKEMLSALQSAQPPPAEAVLTVLINEIADSSERIVLVLDDYHLIDAQPIHDALSFLLRHLPPQMHLVIASREDPPLPLPRLRARSQLTELRATDLRFTRSEAAEFLNQVMGLNLAAEDIAALERRTEGWIAGLQLAAIAVQGTSMQGRKDVAAFITSFTGSHHFVLDYLLEEVLEQQSESVQEFLLQTSILDRLTGPLCDAVRFGEAGPRAGQEDGRTILQRLAHANLFTVPLDQEQRWYRYHHLFSDLLRQRLRQHDPEQMLTLHRRASEWYEQNELMNEAVDHALRAEHFERAVHLIEGVAETYWGRGQATELRSWLVRLPSEWVVSRPDFSIFHAWFLRGRGQLDAAERTLQAAERALEHSSDCAAAVNKQAQGPDQVRFRGRAAAVRAFISSYQGDVPGIIRFGREALGSLPEQDLNWRSMTAIVLGDAHAFRGDMTSAYETRLEALKACKAAGDQHFVIVASLKVAITLRAQGFLRRTLEICQQQMTLVEDMGLSQTRLAGFLLSVWGETLAEVDDLERGLDLVERGFGLLERKANMEMLGWSYLCLMRVLSSRDDWVGAEEATRKLGRIAQETATPAWIPKQMAAWQARLWLAQNKLEAASQWVEERGFKEGREPEAPHEIDFFMLNDYVVLARILFAQGRSAEATKLLLHLLHAAEVGGRTSKAIEIRILQALIFQAGGEIPRALAAVEQALALAEPEGFIRIFVDEGPPMARLLYEALSRGIAPDYTRRLLAAFPVTESEHAAPSDALSPNASLIEPLSERELEVLALLAEGLTNREISSRLYLALNTVKAHTSNIYGKLDVHNRTQAVAKARTLGLLPSI
jgi:LuxR family maltose regulon positive regulatory protein